MIEKGKKYTYDELKEIFKQAQIQTLAKLKKDFRDAQKEKGAEANPMYEMAFDMQNLILFVELNSNLFVGGEK